MYTLVLLVLTGAQGVSVDTTTAGQYPSLAECFDAREELLWPYRDDEFNLPIGVQAVCIKAN